MEPQRSIALVVSNIVNPLVVFLFALGVVVFAWGVVQFIIASRAGDANGMESGKKHMIWGIIGLAIMIAAFGIINLVQGTVNKLG